MKESVDNDNVLKILINLTARPKRLVTTNTPDNHVEKPEDEKRKLFSCIEG